MLSVGVEAANTIGNFMDLECNERNDMKKTCNQGDTEKETTIQCSKCGHSVADSDDIINIESDHSLATGLNNAKYLNFFYQCLIIKYCRNVQHVWKRKCDCS